MKKLLLGSSPLTSVIGIVEGCIIACLPIFTKSGFAIKDDWIFIVGAIVAYLRGRNTKDTNGVTAQQGKQILNVIPACPQRNKCEQ